MVDNNKIRLVKDRKKLRRLRKIPFYETFSRFDEDGRIGYLNSTFESYYGTAKEGKDIREWSRDKEGMKRFLTILYECVGLEGIIYMMNTLEGFGTYSCHRGYTIEDIINETEKILNDKIYIKEVKVRERPDFFSNYKKMFRKMRLKRKI